MDVYGSLKNVKIITLAPELESSENVIKQLTEQGITVAVGHSMASLKHGEAAVQNGASLITHLFNAMSSVIFHFNFKAKTRREAERMLSHFFNKKPVLSSF